MDRGGLVVASNSLPTRTFASQPFIFDREIREGSEMHLLPTSRTPGNPAAIRNETGGRLKRHSGNRFESDGTQFCVHAYYIPSNPNRQSTPKCLVGPSPGR